MAAISFGLADRRAPLIGRFEEVRQLTDLGNKVRERGEAQIVTLVGPAGVGKTRIVDEYLSELAQTEGRRARIFRGSGRAPRSHGLFARLLSSRFGLVDGMDHKAQAAQIRSQVSKVLADPKVGGVCFFLGQLLDVPFEPDPLTDAVVSDAFQAGMLRRAVLKSFFESDARRGPIILVCDDIHACGEDSMGLLGYLIHELRAPILIICLTRPELVSRHPTWFDFGGKRHHRIDVAPVAQDVAAAIMRALLAPCEGGPPEQLVQAGVELASGTPALLEGMVRIFHDSGVLNEMDALSNEPTWTVNLEKLKSVQLPVTVTDAVATRVAALTREERQLLQSAAVMGQVFVLGALLALERTQGGTPDFWSRERSKDELQLKARLEALVQREYLTVATDSRYPKDTAFAFKHEREREHLLDLVPAPALKRVHQMLADWYAYRPPPRANQQYLVTLAEHLEHAGSTTRAGLTYIDAGDLARSSYAPTRAEKCYARGLALLGSADGLRRMSALQHYGDTLVVLGRHEEAQATFREMLEIAYRLDLKKSGGAAHNRLGRMLRDLGSFSEAREHFETAVVLFEEAGDERGVATCHDDIGKLLWMKGDYAHALERLHTALQMRHESGERRAIAQSLHNMGMVWRDRAQSAQAQEALDAALKIRREIADQPGVSETLFSLAGLALDHGDLHRALELAQESYEVARELGERNRVAARLSAVGEMQYRLGDPVAAIETLKEAEELCDDLGDKLQLAQTRRGLAKAYLIRGDLKKARINIKHAVDVFGKLRSKPHLAFALRTLGEVTAAGAWGESHKDKAMEYFRRSVALCQEMGNDVETAKSYQALADFILASVTHRNDKEMTKQAERLRRLASEIFDRLRMPKDRLAEA